MIFALLGDMENVMKTYAKELQTIIAESQTWLAQIDEAQAKRIAGSRWMVKEIVGHLIDSACNNHQRWIRLQQGNLLGFPPYDQNHWVARAGYAQMPWKPILELWLSYNAMLVELIAHIDERMQGNYWELPERTLAFLVRDYFRHVRHHLQQIHPAGA